MLGTHTDITERKATEEALRRLNQDLEQRVEQRTAALQASQVQLRESQIHLLAAQRIASLGSWEFDVGTGQINWSDQVYRIFGRDPDSGPPSFAELEQHYPPLDRERHRQAVEQSIASQQPYEIELSMQRSDGAQRIIQARGEPVLDHDGQLIRLVGTVQDLTERKQGEAQRRNLADRLALAVKSAALGIWDWDIVKDELTWDRRMYELYGISADTFTSTYDAWANGLHPEDRSPAEQAIQLALHGEKEFDTEFRVVHPDGNICYIKAFGLIQRDQHNAPLRMIGINFDITERKQAELREREISAQLRAANHELEAFAYSVSHDLRAPLRAVDGFSKAFIEDYEHLLDATGRDYLSRIRGGVQRMGMLIDDLLRLSRVSRSDMQYQQVDLSALVQRLANELYNTQPERQVQFIIAPGVRARVDPNLIRIALDNLLQNAWKFTSKHATACIEFGVLHQEEQRVYFVRDDGAGFDMAFASKLFGVFQRLHDHHEFPGTGIGLATVQRVIARHGGRVWATSGVEQGACFYFTLAEA